MSDTPQRLEDLEDDDLVGIFVGDLQNCRQRLAILDEEEIEAQIVPYPQPTLSVAQPIFLIQARVGDLPHIKEIFDEIWNEVLTIEGLAAPTDGIVDLTQDTITCPGCAYVIRELTAEGECPECGLFLGFPESPA